MCSYHRGVYTPLGGVNKSLVIRMHFCLHTHATRHIRRSVTFDKRRLRKTLTYLLRTVQRYHSDLIFFSRRTVWRFINRVVAVVVVVEDCPIFPRIMQSAYKSTLVNEAEKIVQNSRRP